MGPLSIIHKTIGGIVYELSQGLMTDAVSHWQTLGKALGKCASVCGASVTQSTKKCADCLAEKLINEYKARHLSEEERDRKSTRLNSSHSQQSRMPSSA